MTSLLPAALSLAMVTPGSLALTSPQASATEPAQAYYRAHVTIDTTALAEEQDSKEVERQQDLFEREMPTFFVGSVELADAVSNDTAEVKIIVRWKDFADFRYEVTLEATTPSGATQRSTFDFQGDEHDLIERFEAEVPTVIGWLERPPEPHTAPTPEQPTTTHDTEDQPPKGRGLLWTGVGLSIVGAALLPTGIALHLQTDEETNGFGSTSTERRHPLALTGTLMGVGAASLVTGAALIVIGLKERRASKPSASLLPSASPQHVGLSLQGRF